RGLTPWNRIGTSSSSLARHGSKGSLCFASSPPDPRGTVMIQAAHSEIRRLTHLHDGTELQLMLLTERRPLTAADECRVVELRQRKLQLRDRIAWFEAILREHDAAE